MPLDQLREAAVDGTSRLRLRPFVVRNDAHLVDPRWTVSVGVRRFVAVADVLYQAL